MNALDGDDQVANNNLGEHDVEDLEEATETNKIAPKLDHVPKPKLSED